MRGGGIAAWLPLYGYLNSCINNYSSQQLVEETRNGVLSRYKTRLKTSELARRVEIRPAAEAERLWTLKFRH